MISVQNLPQLLNGNKNGTIIVIGLIVKRLTQISLLAFLIGLLGFRSEPIETPVTYQSDLPVYNVALFLPLHLHNKERRESDTTSAIYDFYEGIQAAIKNLEQIGLNMRLHVFDTELDSSRVDSFFRLPRLQQMNTIIGPIYPVTHSIAERFCAVTKIPLISPFMHYKRQSTASFPHINLIPSDTVSTFGLGQGMARLYPEYTLIVVSDGQSKNFKKRKLFKEGYRLVSEKRIIQIPQHDLSQLYALSNKRNVMVYSPTDSLPVLKKMANLAAIGKIKLALDKKYKKKKGFGKDQMKRAQIHFQDNNYYDKYAPNALSFRKMYREVYKWEANSYHFRGYDQMTWLGQSLMTFKQTYPKSLGNAFYPGIMQQFCLRRVKNGGFENAGCKILKYNNKGARQEITR